jgi:hypothetical protein
LNAFYHADQKCLPSFWLSKNEKFKIYRCIILPFVLYLCETRFLTLREKQRWKMFESRVLRRIFGPKKGEMTGDKKSVE